MSVTPTKRPVGPPAPTSATIKPPNRGRWARASLMAPAALLFIPFLAIVLGRGITISLYGENLLEPASSDDFVGFGNYLRAFQDSTLLTSVRVTLVYMVVAVSLQMLIGVGIALLMRRHFPAKGIVRALVLIPMVLTPVVAGLTWRLLYDPTAGTVNWFLGVVGLGSDHAFLSNPETALLAVVLVDVWQNTPYVIIIVLAGLESIDPAPLEAASIDGATGGKMVWHVILPMVRPVLAIVVMLRLIDAAKTFPLTQTMTGGGPGTATMAISNYVYREGFTLFNIGYSTTLGLITAVALMILVFPFARRVMGLGGKP